MNADSPVEVIDQHIADGEDNKDTKELIEASERLVEKYNTATRAAKETNASSSSLSYWTRLGSLPDDILGHVYMGELNPTSADIIRRIESSRDQRLISIATIQESLQRDYVQLLESGISNENKTAEEAIESELGEATKLRSVTLGFDQDTYVRLWSEAGRRQCPVVELCQKLIQERLDQIDDREDALVKADQVQEATGEVIQYIHDFESQVEELGVSINTMQEGR